MDDFETSDCSGAEVFVGDNLGGDYVFGKQGPCPAEGGEVNCAIFFQGVPDFLISIALA